jgi:acyl-CoA synthetase (AMP-forming)/AMP-acid ligase II
MVSIDNWKNLLSHGFSLKSSGTTGAAKNIFQPPEKLAFANQVALDTQYITVKSKILTVCSMSHAGGVLAQTLPALGIGAYVTVKPFNAFHFWQEIRGYTHTHLTPAHCHLLMNTKTFNNVNLKGLFITCGSDNVPFDIIQAFVSRGATFMCNWGMTEIGPITINTIFDSIDKVNLYRNNSVNTGTLMGDQFYCDYKLINGELWVRGPLCVYDDWFNTHDQVETNMQGALYHMGR